MLDKHCDGEAHNVLMTLHEYMQAEGLKDHHAADMFGCDRATVSKMRRGVITPSYPMMLAIRDKTDGKVTLESWELLRLAAEKDGQAA